MNNDSQYLDGFISKCKSAGMDDHQVLDAYTTQCGHAMLQDESFRKGFSEVLKSANLPERVMEDLGVQRILGKLLLNEK